MLLRFLSWLKRRLADSLYRFLRGTVRTVIFVGLIALAWVTWPVSAWLFGAYALHWALLVIAGMLYRPGRQGRPGAVRRVAAHSAYGLSRSVAYVGVGICLVAVAQGALWIGAQAIDPALVRQAEELLSYAYHQLLGVLSLEVLAIALAVLVAVAMVQPRSQALSRFLALRKTVSRAALVLL